MANIPEFTTRPELAGSFGMVASTHWLASAAGMAVLEKGGNAFDAAVAAGFVLQVVEPHMCGPGGEVPVIGYDARRGETFVVCGQGTAPAGATQEAYTALGLDLVPGSGLLAACVPGSFGAWLLLLREYGRLPLRDVLEYAIGYAGSGYPLVPAISWGIASVADLFREHWTSSAQVYLPGGGVPAPGAAFANPALAVTYARVLAEAEAASADRDEQIEAARRAWYDGFVAEAIGRFAATEVMDVTGERHRGFLTPQDMAAWHARLEAPVTYDYAGLTVCKTQPWGQGPVFLQQLALLSGFDLAAMEPGGADHIHTVAECAKLAFADREAWYGDPAYADVPLADLLSAEYNDERRKLIGDTASAELLPGRPGGREPVLSAFATASFGINGRTGRGARGSGDPGLDPATGEPLDRGAGWASGTSEARGARGASGASDAGEAREAREAGGVWGDGHAPHAGGSPGGPSPRGKTGDTCHVDVADRWGNVVTATPSGGWLQSSPVVPELGFCLGTRAQMFTLTPGLPATLAPGKRPRTTLSPTLALRDGEPYLAFGTPGGDQQDQWTLGFFLNHVHFGMNLQQAIDFPAFHSRHMPSSFYPRVAYPAGLDVEQRIAEPVLNELRERGHVVSAQPPWALGRTTAVARRGGMLYAAANPRGMQAYAAGR